jgi:hypothetical protein
VAALNTGNNLLYIIVAAMLAAIAVSGIASAFCLNGLELDLKLPDHIFARKDVAGTVCIRNPRKWIPSLSISAVPVETAKALKRWRWVATTFPVPPWRPPERQWLQLPDRKLRRVAVDSSSGVFHESAYFPLVPPGLQLQAQLPKARTISGKIQSLDTIPFRLPGQDQAPGTRTRGSNLSRSRAI